MDIIEEGYRNAKSENTFLVFVRKILLGQTFRSTKTQNTAHQTWHVGQVIDIYELLTAYFGTLAVVKRHAL
jgi:hypothetical protein